MADAPVLTDYVSLIITLFDLFRQYRSEQSQVKQRRPFISRKWAGSTGIRVVEQAWYVLRGPFFLAATQRNTQYATRVRREPHEIRKSQWAMKTMLVRDSIPIILF